MNHSERSVYSQVFGFSFVITFFKLPLLDNDVLLFSTFWEFQSFIFSEKMIDFQLDFIIYKCTIKHNIFSHSLPVVVLFLPSLSFAPCFHVCGYMPSKRLSRYFMSFSSSLYFSEFFLNLLPSTQTILIIHSLNL